MTQYLIDYVGGMCPTQAWGRTSDDRPFYFRSRHDHWQLHVGDVGWPTDFTRWPMDDYEDRLVDEGIDGAAGALTADEVKALLDEYFARQP